MTRIPLILSLLALLPASALAQNTWFVPDDFPTIQAGIDGSVNGDTVIVRDGTYEENINFNGKAITLKSENGPATTIIDGKSLGSVVTITSGEGSDSVFEGFTAMRGVAMEGAGLYCKSASPTLKNCVFEVNLADYYAGGMLLEDSSAIVEDCVFKDNVNNNWDGGGVVCTDGTSATFTNCTFKNNVTPRSGGGMHCSWNSSPTLTNCTFTGNTAFNPSTTEGVGGGMSCDSASSPTLDNCTFTNNTAYYGGGMSCHYGSSPTLENCAFTNNTATQDGGGMHCKGSSPSFTGCEFSENDVVNGHGGGVWLHDTSYTTFVNCRFANNSAGTSAGGAYVWACIWTSFTDCEFDGNEAGWDGGGMHCDNSSPTLDNCTFTNNSASHDGGGMYCWHSSPTLEGCAFANNVTVHSGGGVHCNSSSPTLTNCMFTKNEANSGAGMYCWKASPTIDNCTFTGNTCWNGGGGIFCNESSFATLTNCIFWNNLRDVSGGYDVSEIDDINSSVTTVTYSNVKGGRQGTGNINAYPLFVDQGNGDFHLQDGSPCIDTGDLNSSNDPDGTRADMGAFYFDQSQDADMDNDGLLDTEELTTYGTKPGIFDTDGDGLGDGQELGVTNADITFDTNQSVFKEDVDPSTITDPLNSDTDGGGLSDGREDLNRDGACDFVEFDPNDASDDLFTLQSSPLIPGQQATIFLSDHRKGSTIAVIYSLNGTGTTSTPFGFDLGLAPPVTALPYQVVFTTSSTQVVNIPPTAPSGLSVWMQGVEKLFFGDFFRLTTVLATQIQ